MKIKFKIFGVDFSLAIGKKDSWVQNAIGDAIDEALRARKGAHEAFDPIWKGGYMTRTEAYRWLAKQLGIEHSECHMSLFDVETCQRVIELSKEYARKKYTLE